MTLGNMMCAPTDEEAIETGLRGAQYFGYVFGWMHGQTDILPTDLPPAPTDPTGERKVYARGVLAMANAGPDTNDSQFFLVYANSALRPNYTIFGHVEPVGLRTLDRIAAGGITPTPEDPAPVDGPPALRTEIRKAIRLW